MRSQTSLSGCGKCSGEMETFSVSLPQRTVSRLYEPSGSSTITFGPHEPVGSRGLHADRLGPDAEQEAVTRERGRPAGQLGNDPPLSLAIELRPFPDTGLEEVHGWITDEPTDERVGRIAHPERVAELDDAALFMTAMRSPMLSASIWSCVT